MNTCYSVLCFSFFLSFSSIAQSNTTVYKTILPNGEVSYSQTSEPGSKPIIIQVTPATLPEKNTPMLRGESNMDETVVQEKIPASYDIRFALPQNEQVYTVDMTQVIVNLQVKPPLAGEDSVQLFIDDKPYGTLQSELDYTISNLERGTHTLAAKIYADKGAGSTKGEAGPISIHIQKPFVRNN